MIIVDIKGHDHNINEIDINGHAGYAINGKDIVCAAVSSIVTTTVNALLRLDDNSIECPIIEDGNTKIIVKKHDRITDTLIINMVELLKELGNNYSKYIKINEEVHP